MAGGGYEVLNEELQGHSGKVDGLAERMQTAVDAARQVTMDNSAFGVICQPFALLLQPFEEKGVEALEEGSSALTETAGKVRDAASKYEAAEGAQSAAIRNAGGGL